MEQHETSSYQIGWICALPTELAASKAMLEEEHGEILGLDPEDNNNYNAGRMHQHKVVIASLPAGEDGIAAAANIAQDMRRSFPKLRAGLLVGIGGGIPSKTADIRLGDVVVSQPSKQHGGVVQYDKGKSLSGQPFTRKGFLNRSPTNLLTALSSLQAEHELKDSQMPKYLSEMMSRHSKMRDTGYAYPGVDQDSLSAEDGKDIERKPRKNTNPHIHYGIIASGNQVIANRQQRDGLRTELGALCVEMEAAGLMNTFPCLVVRGICDYADSEKNDRWHRYASASAAAFAKELLYHISARRTNDAPPISEVLGRNDLALVGPQASLDLAYLVLSKQGQSK